jgi:Tfp pilus assembly protein PilX
MMTIQLQPHKKENGAVSLFVVIFAALLMTVVTLSFLRIMVHDQEQASTNDLSQSAYDSAQAGVEDAKRALLRYQNICNGTDVALCAATKSEISTDQCNAGLKSVVDTGSSTTIPEIQVQQTQSGNDTSLNQAYTCVKVNLLTDDFLGSINPNSSKIIPLFGTSAFSSIKIEWYSSEDLGAITSGSSFNVDLQPASSTTYPLLLQSNWKANRPSILRTQLMQFGTTFSLGNTTTASSFDNTVSGQSDANTLFLYPVGDTGTAVPDSSMYVRDFVSRDVRKTPTGSPLPILCSGTLAGGGYACRTELTLPDPINPAGNGERTAYLRLSPLYNATHFKVSLLDASHNIVQFNGVQPQIDSTGRANDLFRRLQTRVELIDTNFPYPAAAVDVTGSFCKEFAVSDKTADYAALNASSTCQP